MNSNASVMFDVEMTRRVDDAMSGVLVLAYIVRERSSGTTGKITTLCLNIKAAPLHCKPRYG